MLQSARGAWHMPDDRLLIDAPAILAALLHLLDDSAPTLPRSRPAALPCRWCADVSKKQSCCNRPVARGTCLTRAACLPCPPSSLRCSPLLDDSAPTLPQSRPAAPRRRQWADASYVVKLLQSACGARHTPTDRLLPAVLPALLHLLDWGPPKRCRSSTSTAVLITHILECHEALRHGFFA